MTIINLKAEVRVVENRAIGGAYAPCGCRFAERLFGVGEYLWVPCKGHDELTPGISKLDMENMAFKIINEKLAGMVLRAEATARFLTEDRDSLARSRDSWRASHDSVKNERDEARVLINSLQSMMESTPPVRMLQKIKDSGLGY